MKFDPAVELEILEDEDGRRKAGDEEEPVAWRYRWRGDQEWRLTRSYPIHLENDEGIQIRALYLAPLYPLVGLQGIGGILAIGIGVRDSHEHFKHGGRR